MSDETESEFVVVVNFEGQHSIIPEDSPIPLGWRLVEAAGSKATCIDYVNQHWLDIRPQSLIDSM